MISRSEILEKISKSSIFGDLGLFIGGGFSKSVMNKKETIALSWGDLIYKSLFDLKIDINEIKKEGLSYPELASQICHTICMKENIPFDEAAEKLKTKLAEITNWYPGGQAKNEYSKYLKTIKPQWIITTNYDLIIECLLPGMCITLGPEEQMFVPKKLIPIYHIHGIRTNPGSLVITQEDYIRLFRPNEYRQSKLSLTLKESTTLFIGYGLGDINVLSAVDWAKNVFRSENNNYTPDIIQVLVVEGTPNKEVYSDNNGTLILEVNSLGHFFNDLSTYIVECSKREKAKMQELKKFKQFLNPSDKVLENFIHDDSFRIEFLRSFSDLNPFVISGSLVLISKGIEKVWAENQGYERITKILSDFLIHTDFERLPPVIMEMILSNLSKLVSLQGKNRSGETYWDSKKLKITQSNLEALKQNSLYSKNLRINHILSIQ